ncbi:MAG: Vitamin B12 dependent methionine synthase activation subunit [Lachnospiraceae bacterium]|nr:Vitamin B12 dependent methionine synthase activation subunit [Lachnospiraceae bacterium]
MTIEHAGLPLIPDTDEICRYLGYRGNDPGPDIKDRIASVTDELNKGITPGFVYSCWPLYTDAGSAAGVPVIRFGPVTVQSDDLYKNLTGCSRIIVFAATLGPYPDRLQQRTAIKSMRDAVIVQACAAAMIESLCNQKNEELRQRQERDGWLLKPRFSPGYGDLPLSIQKDLLSLLDAPRNIGLTLTDSLMMVPTKSVTALIGLYPDNNAHNTEPEPGRCADNSGCTACLLRETCEYRRK